MAERFDHLEKRCPRLGSLVPFSYCRRWDENGQLCFKLIDCWWEAFDVLSYLREHYPEEVIEKLVHEKPKPKITSLLEIIEQAKKRTGQP